MYRSTTVISDAFAIARMANHARGYHRSAEGFRADGAATSLVFNVASVAIEHYLIALANAHGVEPVSHTFTNLIEDVETLMDVEPDLSVAVRYLDSIFGICSIDDYHHGEPTPQDAERALWVCDQLEQLAAPREDGEAA